MAVRRVLDKWVVLQHGHLWDPSNATPSGGGETMTAVIHHALVPFLRHLAPRTNVHIDPDAWSHCARKSASSPCWSAGSSPDLQSPHRGALGILVENGALARPLAWVTTPSLLRWRLKDDDDLWERAGASALAVLEGAKSLPGKPRPRRAGARAHPRDGLAVQEDDRARSGFTSTWEPGAPAPPTPRGHGRQHAASAHRGGQAAAAGGAVRIHEPLAPAAALRGHPMSEPRPPPPAGWS